MPGVELRKIHMYLPIEKQGEIAFKPMGSYWLMNQPAVGPKPRVNAVVTPEQLEMFTEALKQYGKTPKT